MKQKTIAVKSTSIRFSDEEKVHIKKYCELTERKISDVFREYARSLSIEGKLNPLDGRKSVRTRLEEEDRVEP